MEKSYKYQLIAVGDVFLKTKNEDTTPFNDDIRKLFSCCEYVIANLETVIFDQGRKTQKAVSLRTNQSSLSFLKSSGINIVNIANNHIFDFGVEGYKSTIQALNKEKIRCIGTVKNRQQRPLLLNIGGLTVGILGYSIGGVQKENIGISNIDLSTIISDVSQLKKDKVDKIILTIHWGEEYVSYPSPKQQKLARYLIDNGIDVIIGHHPHVVQGIEKYKKGLIFYSLGNFNFFGSNLTKHKYLNSFYGLIVFINFSPFGDLEYKYLPIHIDKKYRPNLIGEHEKKEFTMYFTKISDQLAPSIQNIFWLKKASWIHFKNNLPSFLYRIKRYGKNQFYELLRWLLHPRNYKFYFGLILLLLSKLPYRKINFLRK